MDRRVLYRIDFGKRLMLCLALLMQLIMMVAGLWPAAWLVLRYAPVAHTPGHWVLLVLAAVIVFNYGYLLALLLLRIVIPRPQEGLYPLGPDGRIPRQVVVFMLNILLVKARFDPPWAAMFSSVLTRIFPLDLLFARFFGPRTRSMTLGDTIICPDPHMVEIGRDVQMGFQCSITAHVFDNRGLLIRKVVIEDGATVGGQALLTAGVRVGHHSVVALRAMVMPNTVIGPYEYWAGAPAKKIKDLTPENQSI